MILLLRAVASFFVLIHFSAGRAVNISNTWVLPEEGFPVFYRYFRDRISWYEADAVCQFHHSYLVTADSTSQYDAIRAYLKELDITDNVWIGLSKNTEKPFTWTNNLQPLLSEGHWQEQIPQSTNPLCAAMDPAKDFLWKTFTCGGPEVASFICETPIPSWAAGPRGCLLTELPSLTVLYIPEQSSVELTSDCGLDGTKRIACKGDADREEILKQLTCAISSEDFEDKPTKSGITSPTASYTQTDGKTTKNSIWTSNTIDLDYGMPTRHRRETEDTLSASSTESTGKITYTLETFTATNYDTEVTTIGLQDHSTMEPIVFNISSPYELEIIQDIPKITSTESPSTSTVQDNWPRSTTITSEIPSTVTPTTVDIVETSSTVVSSTSTSGTVSTTTIASVVEKDVAMEYPSAINQGQLFSIIENGTMFDIIELNETTEPRAETSNTAINQKLKPSTKLSQLDKNTKLATDSKNKAQSKKDIYKNADPKKKNVQKTTDDKNKEKLTDLELSDKLSTEMPLKQKREERNEIKEQPENKTDKIDTKEETDLNSQVEMLPIKQIEEDIEQREDKREQIEESELNKDVEVFEVKNITHVKIDDDIDKKEEQIENLRKEEIDINKEVEIFPIINDKSTHLNRTFRKELPMLADEAKPVDENKIELLDIEETPRKIDNATKIDPNIDALNKNIAKNNDSEIIGQIDKEILKKQLLPKPLQGEKEDTKRTTQKETSTEETIENPDNGDHPKPNRQRQLTRPHGRPFYPNFFSRVLG